MKQIQDVFKHINFQGNGDKILVSVLYLGILIEKSIEEVLKPFDISPPQFRILRVIQRVSPDGIPIYNLNKYMMDPRSDVSRLVARMVKNGWVAKKKDSKDKRINFVRITSKGTQLLEDVAAQGGAIQIEIGDYTEEQLQQFNDFLQIMVDALVTKNELIKAEKMEQMA